MHFWNQGVVRLSAFRQLRQNPAVLDDSVAFSANKLQSYSMYLAEHVVNVGTVPG